MKTLTRLFLATLLALLVWVPLPAQTYLTTTTLSAAITSLTATRITLASTSGLTAAYCGGSNVNGCGLYVDREYMTVSSVPVSGTVNVTRGVAGTPASTHLTGRVVIMAPQSAFSGSDYDGTTGRSPGGPCTASANLYLPIVNTTNGNVWLCRPGVASVNGSTTASATWVATNTAPITYNSLLTVLP